MVNRRFSTVLQHLGRFVDRNDGADRTDSQLLGRFAAQQDQAAFEALVQRHGRLVLGVCQRVLRDRHAAEDAFQAVFFVLARKAAALTGDQPLASWLFTVAYRMALRVRATAVRQHKCREQAAMHLGDRSDDPERTVVSQELAQVLDEEIHRLPEKYRLPLVLCCLEEKTHDEAARELGVPRGSMAKRLAGAQERLRRQLANRGLALSGSALAVMLQDSAKAAVVSSGLAHATAAGAVAFASGDPALVSTGVTALAQGALHAMRVARLSSLAISLAAAVGATVLVCYGLARPADEPAPAAQAPAVEPEAAQDAAVGVHARWRVLDHTGEPVPNVKMRFVAYAKSGQPHGAAWSAGVTSGKGIEEAWIVRVTRLSGHLELEGVHPAIGVVRQRVEWNQVAGAPTPGRAVIEIRAAAGPGLAAWREEMRAAAPDMVGRLLAATDVEAPGLEAQLIQAESAALPALVAAAEDYAHPRRQRLTRPITAIMNGSRGPVDAAVLAKAEPISAVQGFIRVFPESPTARPVDLQRLGAACVKELEWTIADLQRTRPDDLVVPALQTALAAIRQP